MCVYILLLWKYLPIILGQEERSTCRSSDCSEWVPCVDAEGRSIVVSLDPNLLRPLCSMDALEQRGADKLSVGLQTS